MSDDIERRQPRATFDVQVCRVCGCTDDEACEGGCSWTDVPGVCSSCVVTVLAEVAAERARQDQKWGEQNHPDGTGPNAFVLRGTSVNLDLRTGGELAHIFRQFCDEQHRRGEGTYLSILLEEVFEAAGEEMPDALRRELIQVAAVAVAWVEAIDRRQEGASA